MTSVRLAFAALLGNALAQTSTYTDLASVPTGSPIPGDYTGPLRPQVHFSPPQKLMNDPNGMFLDANGTYHLYYQYNPILPVAGNQSWGHATSTDLYRWTNQPIAIHPINESSYIFSGSSVVDTNNTSGFFPDQDNGVVAIYTIATDAPVELQTQGLAISHDGGYTFEQYESNPVLDIGSSQFRDPKVIRYGDRWVMVIAYASEFTVGFFTSPDLKNWTHASNFSTQGWLGVQWECPNMVEIPVEGSDQMMHLLQVSVNPGSPQGGSVSQYFPGNFDGSTFTPVDGAARFTDFAKDNYAGQFFYGLPSGSRPIQMAWASNWEYTQVVPTGDSEGWRSAMTVPRQHSLRRNGGDWALVTQAVDLSPIRGGQLTKSNLMNSSTALDYSQVYSNALYFEANGTEGVSGGTLNFTFSSPVSGEYLLAGLVLGAAQPMWINRGGIRGFDDVFNTNSFSQHTVDGITNVQGIIDRSVLEVFGGNGQISAVATFYPTQPLTVMHVSTSGLLPNNASISLAVYALDSGWRDMENSEGTVLGNVTTNGASGMHKRMLYETKFS